MIDWSTMTAKSGDVFELAEMMDQKVIRQDAMAALNGMRVLIDRSMELAGHLVEQAAREGKSQKAIADAIGVPASTLRGLKQSVR